MSVDLKVFFCQEDRTEKVWQFRARILFPLCTKIILCFLAFGKLINCSKSGIYLYMYIIYVFCLFLLDTLESQFKIIWADNYFYLINGHPMWMTDLESTFVEGKKTKAYFLHIKHWAWRPIWITLHQVITVYCNHKSNVFSRLIEGYWEEREQKSLLPLAMWQIKSTPVHRHTDLDV